MLAVQALLRRAGCGASLDMSMHELNLLLGVAPEAKEDVLKAKHAPKLQWYRGSSPQLDADED